jgi:hypothetical protein
MSLKDFTDAYIDCALWSSTDDNGEPLDQTDHDIANEARDAMAASCEGFYNEHFATWRDAGMDDAQAGHDFWLTRNHHGAGFWGRGIGAAGDKLTEFAHAYGSVDLYVGDDNLIYQMGE